MQDRALETSCITMLGTQQYLTAHIEMAQRAQFLYITTIKLFSLEKKHSGKRKPRAYLNTIKNPSTGSHRSLAVFCKQCAWISRRTKRARSALIRFCAQTPTRQTPPDKRRNSFIPQVPMSAQISTTGARTIVPTRGQAFLSFPTSGQTRPLLETDRNTEV